MHLQFGAVALPLLHLVSASDPNLIDEANALIKWLQANGGYVNPKIQLRPVTVNSFSIRLGLFAEEDIEKGETLIHVPQQVTIGKQETSNIEQSSHPYCDTSRLLAKEMRLQNETEFAMYIDYLQNEPGINPPTGWTKMGKELVLRRLGDLNDWLETDWHELCNGSHDPVEKRAALLVGIHAWKSDLMVPVYDLMRYRNHDFLNTKTFFKHRSKIVVVEASRDIFTGQELYRSLQSEGDYSDTFDIFGELGIVEDFPQRFSLREIVPFDVQLGTEGLNITFIVTPKRQDYIRLANLKEILTETDSDLEELVEDVPQIEFVAFESFRQSLLQAVNLALHKLEDDEEEENHCSSENTNACKISRELGNYYDDLTDPSSFTYDVEVCDDSEQMEFQDYTDLASIKSPFQEMLFYMRDEDKDMCFSLDTTVQICSSYRPHYHEAIVHYTARFLPTIKRVLWVGGGDSMLLHEILKYPSLEFVVGLELDQQVTRNAFKYFGSQPHWDNEKVQWWYGDASKSLLMLPKEYFGSFDMVLVDLSETVMSFKVTKQLDIMEALALLLKPEGILVKNEMYFEKMTDIFNNTVQVHIYDFPVICSQGLSLGSHRLDFLRQNLTDHGIDSANLYIGPLRKEVHHSIIHDYSGGKGNKHCKRDGDEFEKAPLEQDKSPGILMAVDIEFSSITSHNLESFKVNMLDGLRTEGFHVTSHAADQSISYVSLIIFLEEGYISAKYSPHESYCAFDIHLWANFGKQNAIKQLITDAIGGNVKTSSSFRIVAGGVYGVSTWKADEESRGPRRTVSCISSTNTPIRKECDEDQLNKEELNKILFEKSIAVSMKSNDSILVLCGIDGGDGGCPSLNILCEEKNNIVGLFCPNLIAFNGTTAPEKMSHCRKELKQTIKKSLHSDQTIGTIVVDPSAPIEMGQIIYSIFKQAGNGAIYLSTNLSIFTMSSPNNQNEWHEHFTDRFRTEIIIAEPVFKAKVEYFNSDTFHVTTNVLSTDPLFTLILNETVLAVEEGANLTANIVNVKGGQFVYHDDFSPSLFFKPHDYDQSSSLEQWYSQKMIDTQMFIQLEGGSSVLTSGKLQYVIRQTMGTSFKDNEYTVLSSNIGEGYIEALVWSTGRATILWDGRNHIDINIVASQHLDSDNARHFVNNFKEHFPDMKIIYNEDIPRGIGRVITSRTNASKPYFSTA
jgi:spermidine synthase